MISGDSSQQPDLFGVPEVGQASKPDPKAQLHNALIKLGDMIGDGLADEPGGEWISAEYKRVARALGHTFPRRNRAEAINEGVRKYLEANNCPCGGSLRQTRSGAMRVTCSSCTRTIQLKAVKGAKAG